MGFVQQLPNWTNTKIDLDNFGISQGVFVADPTKNEIVLNTHMLLLGPLAVVYLIIEPFVGILTVIMLATLYTIAQTLNTMDAEVFGGNLFRIFMTLHIFGWIT